MTIEKLQTFLKKKHKFDKIDIRDCVEELDEGFEKFKQAIHENAADPSKIRTTLSNFMLCVLKYANTKDISLNELADEQYNS